MRQKMVIHTFRAEMITENRALTEKRSAGIVFFFFFEFFLNRTIRNLMRE